MTGTAREVTGELWSVYRLAVATIPLNRPDRKIVVPWRAYPNADAKWAAIAAEVAAIHATGAPVLIGTRTVGAARVASEALTARGLDHVVLSAAQDSAEAAIVAQAGQVGAITVATNMAGRGTDIRLNEEARARGGLHVIISELHEAGRIDRQLGGRCGRQGDPGRISSHVALDDDLIQRHAPPVTRAGAGLWFGPAKSRWLLRTARLAQRHAERLHARMRADLLRSEEWIGDAIGFVGEQE
jgi:preprotein translocase subunit SecA